MGETQSPRDSRLVLEESEEQDGRLHASGRVYGRLWRVRNGRELPRATV